MPNPGADEQELTVTQLEIPDESGSTELVSSPHRTEYLIVRGRREMKDGRSHVSLHQTTITTREFDGYDDGSRFAPPVDRAQWHPDRDGLGWGRPIEPTVRESVRLTSKDDDDQVSLADIVDKLRRAWGFTRRYGILMTLIAMLGAGLGAWSYLLLPPASTAYFRIRLIPEASENPLDPYRPRDLEFFSSAQRNFTTKDLVKKTLMAQGHASPDNKTVDAVRQRLEFDSIESEVYEGRYSQRAEADSVVDFLASHLDLYLETEIRKAIHTLQAEVEWLRGKLKAADAQLRKDEAALMAFKKEHIDQLPALQTSHQAALMQIEEQERALRAEAERAGLQLGALSQQLNSDRPLQESRAAAAAPFRTQVADLEQQLAAARTAGKGAEHPDVLTLTGQLARAKSHLDAAVHQGDAVADAAASGTYRELERTAGQLRANHRAASGELARLSAERQRLEVLAKNAPEVEFDFVALTRAVETSKLQADQLRDTVTKKELLLNMEREKSGARYEILEPPQEISIAPWKVLAKRCILGAFAGFMLGLMFGLSRDLFRRVRGYWRAGPPAPGGVPARRQDPGPFMALPPAP